ncbi:MAG: TatD family hydrolase [Treponema sp.]|nr:TatD family hydrolase [Treponema sp.]
MLEKDEKNHDFSQKNIGFCDAHFHFAVCKEHEPDLDVTWNSCSCAHCFSEWEIQKAAPANVLKAFGLHPQLCTKTDFDLKRYAYFLENLLHERNAVLANGEEPLLKVIGEAGFDYFTPSFKEKRALQEEMWNLQLDLAEFYKVPLVIHCRKANEKLFEYAPRLKKLPFVLFHSFMGSVVEAKSLIGRGINCAFSFGKQLKNGNKKVIECVKNLPLENLLLETDAPFQTLKGEAFTKAKEIAVVYEEASALRAINMEELKHHLMENFAKLASINSTS